MNAYFKHLKTVCRHKWYVLRECAACGILWQGLVHDLSKFSPAEFFSSAKYFQGNRSPIEAEKEDIGYSAAWLHHKGHNKHHWEYWTDFADNGDVIANRIPAEFVVEMVCDWIGAGKAYDKEEWNPHKPLAYFNKVREGRHFHPATEALIRWLLTVLDEQGTEAFHNAAMNVKHWANAPEGYGG